MSLKKTILSTVAAATLASTGLMAAAVELDNTANYLVFSNYNAEEANNWSTNLKVVNTNATHSIVAKVVIREFKNSREKLDFPIYLSPTDVWEGRLFATGGKVYIESSDDSMIKGGVPGNVTKITYPLFDDKSDEDSTQGYVEVFTVGQSNATVSHSSLTGGSINFSVPGVNKADFYKVYSLSAPLTNSPLYAAADWTAADDDSIYGQSVISADNTDGQLAMTYLATAISGIADESKAPNEVIAVDTVLGDLSSLGTVGAAAAIDAAIAKTNNYVTFYGNGTELDNTVIISTFITKKYHGYDSKDGINFAYKGYDQYEVPISTSTGELSGGTVDPVLCFTEICQIDIDSRMEALTSRDGGWTNFMFTNATPIVVVNPTPALVAPWQIPLVMTAKKVGTTNVTNIVKPAYQ